MAGSVRSGRPRGKAETTGIGRQLPHLRDPQPVVRSVRPRARFRPFVHIDARLNMMVITGRA